MATWKHIALVAIAGALLSACGGASGGSATTATGTGASTGETGGSATAGSSSGSGSSSSGSTGSTTSSTGNTSGSSPSTPTTTFSPFEGIWSGPTTNTTAGYPGIIVDVNGVYWIEDVSGYLGAFTGTFSSVAWVYVASANEDNHGYDTMVMNSAVASGGVLTLEGTLTGNCPPTQTGSLDYCSFSFQEAGVFPWTYQATLEQPTPPVSVASLAGDWTTTWGSALTINADGTFTLIDNAGALYVSQYFQPSGCTYTGQITLLDPTQNVYSVTATVTPIADWFTASACSGTAQGVFTLLNGQLAGGLADALGDFAVLDTEAP